MKERFEQCWLIDTRQTTVWHGDSVLVQYIDTKGGRKEEEEGSLALYTHRVKWVHYIDEENDMVYTMRSWNSSSKLLVLLAITKRASKWSPICSYMDKKNYVNALLYLILSLCYICYVSLTLFYIIISIVANSNCQLKIINWCKTWSMFDLVLISYYSANWLLNYNSGKISLKPFNKWWHVFYSR